MSLEKKRLTCDDVQRILGSGEEITSEDLMGQLNDHERDCPSCSLFVDGLIKDLDAEGDGKSEPDPLGQCA